MIGWIAGVAAVLTMCGWVGEKKDSVYRAPDARHRCPGDANGHAKPAPSLHPGACRHNAETRWGTSPQEYYNVPRRAMHKRRGQCITQSHVRGRGHDMYAAEPEPLRAALTRERILSPGRHDEKGFPGKGQGRCRTVGPCKVIRFSCSALLCAHVRQSTTKAMRVSIHMRQVSLHL